MDPGCDSRPDGSVDRHRGRARIFVQGKPLEPVTSGAAPLGESGHGLMHYSTNENALIARHSSSSNGPSRISAKLPPSVKAMRTPAATRYAVQSGWGPPIRSASSSPERRLASTDIVSSQYRPEGQSSTSKTGRPTSESGRTVHWPVGTRSSCNTNCKPTGRPWSSSERSRGGFAHVPARQCSGAEGAVSPIARSMSTTPGVGPSMLHVADRAPGSVRTSRSLTACTPRGR